MKDSVGAKKHPKHFDIYINGKRFSIFAISRSVDKNVRYNEEVESLCLKTKIKGQGFPKDAIIQTDFDEENIEYRCTWSGTAYQPGREDYFYKVVSKQKVE